MLTDVLDKFLKEMKLLKGHKINRFKFSQVIINNIK